MQAQDIDILRFRTEHNDARRFGRWVRANISEVEIEGDESSPLPLAGGVDIAVRKAGETLILDSLDVEIRRPKELADNERWVLVELEAHASQVGSATIRSRASSAA